MGVLECSLLDFLSGCGKHRLSVENNSACTLHVLFIIHKNQKLHFNNVSHTGDVFSTLAINKASLYSNG